MSGGEVSEYRGDSDKVTASGGGKEIGEEGGDCVERGVEVRVEGVVYGVGGQGGEREGVDGGSGIVDEDCRRPELDWGRSD